MDKPVMKDSKPIKVKLEEGKYYAWCACGRTEREVFCDSSHKKTNGLEPVFIKATETKEVMLCQCKQTGNPPYCDGTHKKL